MVCESFQTNISYASFSLQLPRVDIKLHVSALNTTYNYEAVAIFAIYILYFSVSL